MTKKQIIITISVSLFVFLIAIIGIFIYHKKSEQPIVEDEKHNYAVNPVEDQNKEDTDIEENVTIVINEVQYNNVDLLTPSQSTDKANFAKLVNTYANETRFKKVKSVNISTLSTDEQVYATLYFEDETSDEVVVLYDKFTTHSFMHCVNLETLQSIENGDNAG